MLATIIDLHAIWKILLAALVVGVGVTAVFGQGALAAHRLAMARRDDRARPGAILANGAVIALAGIVCAAALVVGFIAMTHK
jgi:hypothetical protein